MPPRRTFLAIPVPEKITHLQNNLRENNSHLKKIKWARNRNIHLTIYFIGNIPSEKFESVVQLLAPVIFKQKKISLSFESLFLTPSSNPKMLWIKYRKNESFKQLSDAIHLALSGILPENKFHFNEPIPHITIGRFHSLRNYDAIIFPEKISLPDLIINSCELWESVKVEGRSDYRSILSFPFKNDSGFTH